MEFGFWGGLGPADLSVVAAVGAPLCSDWPAARYYHRQADGRLFPKDKCTVPRHAAEAGPQVRVGICSNR